MILEPRKIIPLLGIQYGMTILDIGSGVGFWAKQLSQVVGSAGKVLALDNNPDVTTRFYNDLKDLGVNNIFPITGDVQTIHQSGISAGTCDKVLIIRMMDYFPDSITEIVEDLKGVVKPGGEIVVIDSFQSIRELKKQITGEIVTGIEEKTGQYYSGIKIIC